MFPETSRGKHFDSRENKTNWFPEGPDIKCLLIFLDFHFNRKKRITGANQNSRLGTCNNTNLILKINDLQSVLLILSASFSHREKSPLFSGHLLKSVKASSSVISLIVILKC